MGEGENILAVIPARHASTRFPGKPLAPIAGKPLIQHVYERVRAAEAISEVLVATDDERIRAAVEGFGGRAVLTRADHRNGTERIAEVAAHRQASVYVNVQGDEPLVDPGTINAVVAALLDDETVQIATPCAGIRRREEIMDPNVVKVVRDFDLNAIYFSRAPIPWVRDSGAQVAARHWKHIGLYAMRRDALLEYPTLPPGELERLEQLEQLRWIENGFRIRTAETEYDGIGVDTPEDAARAEAAIQGRA